jgi:hypothetical protein
MKGKTIKIMLTAICVIQCFIMAGCIDRGSPWFQEHARNEGERETRATEALIEKSVDLQKLEAVCKDLPFFRTTEPLVKGISRTNDELFYYYHLDVVDSDVNAAVKADLQKKGWQFIRENDGFWEHQIEFEKDHYFIQVTFGNFGDSNYGTNCKDSSLSN